MIDYVTLVLGECQVICPGARRGQQSPDIRLANWNRNQGRQLAARQESRTGVPPKLSPPLSLSLTESDDKETLNKDIKCRKCTQTDLLILLVSQIDVKWTLNSGLGKIGYSIFSTVWVLGVLNKYLCKKPFSFKAFYFFTASIIKTLRC